MSKKQEPSADRPVIVESTPDPGYKAPAGPMIPKCTKCRRQLTDCECSYNSLKK